jgi:PLP dependent protein
MNDEFDYIRYNFEKINERITAAVLKAGRNREDVKLIAVSKTIDAKIVKKALECGVTDLGENRVQELCDKADIIDMKCNWHLIGHLQTNKVKYIIDKVTMIHSLDSMELAAEIQKRAEKAAKQIKVLVQVNIAAEDTKFGIKPEEALGFIKNIANMGNIKVKGLMTIAPLAENPEDVRWVFASLRKLLIDISKENIDNIDMDYLSMGMTNDFEVAIEEGSSMVRIGTAIFGKRY